VVRSRTGEEKEMSNKTKQDLNSILYQIFSMAGAFSEVKQVEKLRILTSRLSATISMQSREDSIELMRKLQQAVTSGFKKTFAANEKLEKRVKALEEKVDDSKCCGACEGKDRGDSEAHSES